MFQKTKGWLWFVVMLASAVSLFIIVACNEQLMEGYEWIVWMPIAFCIVFLLFYRVIVETDYAITMLLYFGTQLIRFVIAPAAIALAGKSLITYLPIQSQTIRLATALMIIELVVVSVFVVIRGMGKIPNKNTQTPVLAGSPMAYWAFAGLAVLLFVYFKTRGVSLVRFIALSVGEGERTGDGSNTLHFLSTQIVTLAISFCFVMAVNWSQRRYALKKRDFYANYAIFAAIMVVCVIVGERRSAQVYSAITTCYILILAFPEKRKRIIALVAGVALAIFALMSVYKVFAAFLYDSYSEALANAQWSVTDFAATLQSYFAGPENVALAIEFGRNSSVGLRQAIFDVLRSTVPISFLMKPYGTITSVQMNNWIYSGMQDSGHVLSGAGYGYVFGGEVLCFLPMLINVAIAFFAEKRLRTTKSYEGLYIWLTVMLRFALNLSANTPALISAATNYLFTAGVALGASILIKKVVK